MDEARRAGQVQGRVFKFLQQTVSEFFIQKKEKYRQDLQENKFKNLVKYEGDASDRARQLKMQHDIQVNPNNYHILYMEYGDAKEFENRLREQGIDYLKVDPNIDEARGDGFIISDEDYQAISMQEDLDIVHLYDIEQYKASRDKLLNEDDEVADEELFTDEQQEPVDDTASDKASTEKENAHGSDQESIDDADEEQSLDDEDRIDFDSDDEMVSEIDEEHTPEHDEGTLSQDDRANIEDVQENLDDSDQIDFENAEPETPASEEPELQEEISDSQNLDDVDTISDEADNIDFEDNEPSALDEDADAHSLDDDNVVGDEADAIEFQDEDSEPTDSEQLSADDEYAQELDDANALDDADTVDFEENNLADQAVSEETQDAQSLDNANTIDDEADSIEFQDDAVNEQDLSDEELAQDTLDSADTIDFQEDALDASDEPVAADITDAQELDNADAIENNDVFSTSDTAADEHDILEDSYSPEHEDVAYGETSYTETEHDSDAYGAVEDDFNSQNETNFDEHANAAETYNADYTPEEPAPNTYIPDNTSDFNDGAPVDNAAAQYQEPVPVMPENTPVDNFTNSQEDNIGLTQLANEAREAQLNNEATERFNSSNSDAISQEAHQNFSGHTDVNQPQTFDSNNSSSLQNLTQPSAVPDNLEMTRLAAETSQPDAFEAFGISGGGQLSHADSDSLSQMNQRQEAPNPTESTLGGSLNANNTPPSSNNINDALHQSSLGTAQSNEDYIRQSFGTPSALGQITLQENTKMVLSEDQMLDAQDGRSREALNKMLIQVTTGEGTDEAKQQFRETKRITDVVKSDVERWGGGVAGLTYATNSLTNTLSNKEVETLSKLMEGSGYKALNFSTKTATEESLQQVQKFFSDNKLMKMDGSGVVKSFADEGTQYARNAFGAQSLRINGQYVTDKGVVNTMTNYEFASKNFLKASSKYNQKLKPTDARYIQSDDVKALVKKLTANNGANVKKIAIGASMYQTAKNLAPKTALDKITAKPTLNPFKMNNFMAKKALEQDESYQYVMKVPNAMRNGQQLGKAFMNMRSIVSENAAVRHAQQQQAYTRQIQRLRSQGNTSRNAKRIEELRRKARMEKNQAKFYTERHKNSIKTLEKWADKKAKFALKQKATIKKIITRIPGGKKALAARAAALKLKNAVLERIAKTAVAKAFKAAAVKIAALKVAAVTAISAKLAPVIAVIAAAIIQLMKFMVKGCIMMMMVDIIISLVQGNLDDNDPRYQEYQETIFGTVYDGLCELEGEWAHKLKYELFTVEELPWIDDLDGQYAEFLPDGTPDWEHWRISSEQYLTDIVETETKKTAANPPGWGNTSPDNTMAKGPEPFPNAPEEAYKWIRVLDGGVEVQFRGIGGGAGYMSNVREIISMAIVAQASSNAVDMETATPEDHEGTGLWDTVKSGVRQLGQVLQAFWNGLSNLFTNLLRTIPEFDDWYVNNEAKKRSRQYMLYCKPLFDYSHQEVYGLQLALHPTERTAAAFAAQDILSDGGEVDTGYNWGYMCSGITDVASDAGAYGHVNNEQDLRYIDNRPMAWGYDRIDDTHTDFDPVNDSIFHGYGCKLFDQFEFNYDSDNDLYYLGEYCEQVQPAWNIPVDGYEEDVCVAPGNDGDRWYQVTKEFGHSDCWEYVGGEYMGRFEVDSEYDHAWFIDQKVGANWGYCAIWSNNGGETYYVNVMKNPQIEGTGIFDENNDEILITTYDVIKYAWRHNCQGDHAGTYCGGHLKIILTGCIYHMTDQQKLHRDDLFKEKLIHEDEYAGFGITPTTSQTIYHRVPVKDNPANIYLVEYVSSDTDKYAPEKEVLDSCKDLFDIDCSYAKKWGVVSIWGEHDPKGRKPDFTGWEYDMINDATTKLEDDWEELYNIKPGNTIGGFYSAGGGGTGAGGAGGAHGGSSNGLAVYLSSTEINVIMTQLDAAYVGDPSWPQRRAAVLTALTYVGKVSYSQAHHGDALSEGAMNDCSGYVSQCWKSVLQQNYTTASFWSSGLPKTRWDGALKPGDIILHYDGAIGDGSGDHALIYIGKDANGNDLSVDCTGGGTYLRSRGSSYYNQAYYIPMDQVLGL